MAEANCVECGFIRFSLIQCEMCGQKVCLNHIKKHRQKDEYKAVHLRTALKQEGLL